MTGSAAALSSAQQEHATSNNGRGLQELDSPFGISETPECNRCGRVHRREGPPDYNCCNPGGAWAGVCGDEGMIARGTANYTYAQGFIVCQERLKRFSHPPPPFVAPRPTWPAENKLRFVHIGKCGGTTIGTWLNSVKDQFVGTTALGYLEHHMNRMYAKPNEAGT